MRGSVSIDSNLLLLLVVGSADPAYIDKHKNLTGYSVGDFEQLVQMISLFSEIVLLPHALAEVSSLARQIRDPAKRRIQEKFRELIETTLELPICSRQGAQRPEFFELGLTDAMLLELCEISRAGLTISLLTADNKLAVQAEMLGYEVLNFLQWR